MFERFTDPVTVVRTVLARDMTKLRRLIDGGARVDRRTTYDPWMTPLDAACSTNQIEAVDALLPHQVPAREAVLREARALTAPPPHASDLQGVESLPPLEFWQVGGDFFEAVADGVETIFSRVYFTSAEVSGSPSCQVAKGLSVTVMLRPSAAIS